GAASGNPIGMGTQVMSVVRRAARRPSTVARALHAACQFASTPPDEDRAGRGPPCSTDRVRAGPGAGTFSAIDDQVLVPDRLALKPALELEGPAGDDPDMFLTHDPDGATGVSGFISYDFCRLAGRVPRPSLTFLFQGASMRCFVSSSIDLGSRLR